MLLAPAHRLQIQLHAEICGVNFWLPKFEQNIARDRVVTRTLRKRGWKVIRIWECQLTRKKQARVMRRLRTALLGRTD